MAISENTDNGTVGFLCCLFVLSIGIKQNV
jgi:hypothetical protein